MSTITSINYDSRETEDFQGFEKIKCGQRAIMPVHQSHTAISASHRTPASRRTSRRVSTRKSGMHHRRHRQIS
jgi:hypothetical protein